MSLLSTAAAQLPQRHSTSTAGSDPVLEEFCRRRGQQSKDCRRRGLLSTTRMPSGNLWKTLDAHFLQATSSLFDLAPGWARARALNQTTRRLSGPRTKTRTPSRSNRIELLEVTHPPASRCSAGASYGIYDDTPPTMWVRDRCCGRFLCDGWLLYCGTWLSRGFSQAIINGSRLTNCTCGTRPNEDARAEPLVAHLIVGQVRGFLDPRVLHSLRTQTIEAFGGVPDVFLYLKHELNDDLAAIEAAARSLGSRVQLELRQGNTSDQLTRERLGCGVLQGYEHNFGIASMDRREAFNMVIEHEKKRRQRYDLILRLRPDEFFCTPLPRHDQVDWLGAYSNKFVAFQAYTAPGIHDHAAAMNRAVAGLYFDSHRELVDTCAAAKQEGIAGLPRALYSGLCNYHATSNLSQRSVPAECIQVRWLNAQGVTHDNGAVFGPARSCLVGAGGKDRMCTNRRGNMWAGLPLWSESMEQCALANKSHGALHAITDSKRLVFSART